VPVGRSGLAVAAVVLAAWPALVAAQSIPSCQLASRREDLTVTVAMRTSPGMVLRVEWGDGTVEETSRPTSGNRGRAFLRHEFPAPGSYTVKATAAAPDGRGCGTTITAQLPDTSEVGQAAAAVLPGSGRAHSSDELDDRDLGEPMEEARVAPAPQGRSLIDAVRDFVGTLFGQ
jgi:hypothetical protein